MTFYTTLKDSINVYTGLSPAAFFTILSLMAVVYSFVSGMFVSPEEEKTERSSGAGDATAPSSSYTFVPPQDPVQIGDMTLEELRAYDGSDSKKPLLVAIKGQVYDVSNSRSEIQICNLPQKKKTTMMVEKNENKLEEVE